MAATVIITNNDLIELESNKTEQDIMFKNVTKISVGYKVIYLEYFEDGMTKIRAFGRKEFKNVVVYDERTKDAAQFPLAGVNFKRFDARFETSAEEDFFYVGREEEDEAPETEE